MQELYFEGNEYVVDAEEGFGEFHTDSAWESSKFDFCVEIWLFY
jgi:hypothetical protein